MKLDKFYTQTEVATKCYRFLVNQLNLTEDELFLEPSAGNGAFLSNLKNYIALDIKPENENIVQQDFLTYQSEHNDLITIGNPPFGKRSKLAIDFFNKASSFSEVIAFIVPVSFMKWNVQKELNTNFALRNFVYLKPESFMDGDKPYSIRTVFQIWVKKKSKYDNGIDLRLKKIPSIKHPDVEIWQYNATPESVNTVEENWKYAVYRQGYHDYNLIFTHDDYEEIKTKMTQPTKKQQFFFINPLTEEAEKIVLSMDFNSLAARNTATPGFGKGDFVDYYIESKEREKNGNSKEHLYL